MNVNVGEIIEWDADDGCDVDDARRCVGEGITEDGL